MSNSRRPPRGAAGRPAAPTRVAKVRDPGDIVSVIPYLVGFTPTESVVLIALEGARQRFGPCLRMDLVDDPRDSAAQASHLVEIVRRHGFDPVVVVAFAAGGEVADAVIGALLSRLSERAVAVKEALRADGRRWWSYTCADPECCPPEGTAYDVETSRMAAEAVLCGMARAESRDALRAQLGPAGAAERARFARLCRAAPLGATPEVLAMRLQAGLVSVGDLSMTDRAALVTAVQDVRCRDQAWAAMTRADADAHYLLWRELLRLVPDDLLPPVGALAAFSAWLWGQGVLASHAVDRVADVDPAYSMMVLIRGLLDMAISPEVWGELQTGRGELGREGSKPEGHRGGGS